MRHAARLTGLLVLGAGLAGPAPWSSGRAAAQGIECGKARSPAERAICASPALIALDRQSSSAYAEAVARQPERRDALRQEQLAWLRSRDAACALPARAVAACLGGQITARIAALAPSAGPVVGRVAGGRAGPAGTVIDPPRVPLPDPAVPATVFPQGAAALEQASLPAAEAAETLLQVTAAGRFTLAAKGPGGVALQLVDMLTGPSALAGAAGSQDGRMDTLLDVGTYKMRVFAAKGASGAVALSVTPFREAGPPAALPRPGRVASATLRDGEQRSFWLSVPADGAVRIEAAGRALADLRLWRDGRELSGLEPSGMAVEPVPGHPLTDLRLVGTVEAGTYLVVAYGGVAATWTDDDGAQPLHVRAGASDALQAGWAGGPVGPFGSEVFELPASTALLRLRLPAAAAAELVAGSSAAIARDSREPAADLPVVPGQQRTVEVRGAAGQAFTLRALDRPPGRTVDRPGTYWVSAVANGAGGDEVPVGVVLERSDRSGKPARIVAESLPSIGAESGWRARFNLRGATTLVARSGGGRVSLRTSGVAVREDVVRADLPEGVYAVTLTPQPGALGAVEVVLGPPGASPAATPAMPADPVLPLGVQTLAAGERLRLSGTVAPGLSLGLSARPVPVALAEGPLAVTLAAGAGLAVPVQVAAGGALSVTEVGSGAVPYLREEQDGRSVVTLPPGDHARTVVLAWRRVPAGAAAIPTPGAADTEAGLRAGTPAFFDLGADERRSFALTAGEGGLYRIETLGRLRTEGQLATAFLPRLGEAAANGTGQNMLIQTTLRAGRYRVAVTARDSAGHAGLLATRAPLLPTAELRPGGSVRATLPAGSGAAIPIVLDAEQVVHLDVASLGEAWRGRLEDSSGWPLTTPGGLDGIERRMPAGRYRVVVEPAAVTRQVVVRLRSVEPPVAIAGHGPHALPFAEVRNATWREPDSRAAGREPDRWAFALAGEAEVTLRLTETMTGELRRAGSDKVVQRVNRRFTGRLEAGSYELAVRSLGRNDRAEYTVALDSPALQPGVPRQVALPATLPLAIAAPRVVSLTSFGNTPVKAVLRDASGAVVARVRARADDWNVALSRPLAAGRYTMDLVAASAPDPSDTTERDGPAPVRYDNNEGSGEDEASERDDQVAQTRASQLPDPVAAPKKPAAPDGDEPAPMVEVRLSLPPALDPAPAPAAVAALPGTGVHVLTLGPAAAGSLVLAQARSDSSVALTLERQAGDGWAVVAQDEGRMPVVAAAADGDPRPWRVQAWTVDDGPAPVQLAARAVTAAEAGPGRVTLGAVDGMPGALGVARLRMAPGLVRLGDAPEGLLAGGWPGLGLLVGGGVLAHGGEVWLLGPPGAGALEAAPLAVTPGAAVALTVPAGVTATLPEAGPSQLWEVRGAGRPSLGAGMGWAPGSAVALGGMAVPLSGGAEGELRVDLRRFDLVAAPARAVDGVLHAVVPPGGALPVTLPAGDKEVRLELAAGTGAIPRGEGGAAWAGDGAVSRTLSGGWTELMLVNPGAAAAAIGVSVSPAPVAGLAPGQVLKRFFGAAGSFEVRVQGAAQAKVHLSGPGSLAVIGVDGRVGTGRDQVLERSGRAIVSHGTGALALWVEAPDASPWPVVPPQALGAPGRVALAGEAMAFTLDAATPVLLHASTTAPVLLGLVQAGRIDEPAPFPAGAEVHRMVAAGSAELRLYSPHDGPLSGTLAVRMEPILAVGEGLGEAVAVAPGGSAAFGFALSRAATVGVGVRAEPDRASARLLDASGRVVGEGVAQLASLPAGRYVLEAQVPADAPATVVRPALVGITPRPNGPPPDVVRDYLELAGMKPQELQQGIRP